MASIWLGEFVSLAVLAFALGLDAFSVSLGMGMQVIRLKRVFFIGIMVGIFHMVMPFIGITLGKLVSSQFDQATILIGGALLLGLGAHMFFSSFRDDKKPPQAPIGPGVYLFAFTVSIDSFSAGLSLGISGAGMLMAVVLFGCISMVLTWLGFILGRKAKGLLGTYSELLGGSILCGIGLNMIF
ncbi:manganese efflux pump MntP family protein [Thalassobacillus pellis]|uniref:manganese efflux pump MntP n=1 Tax=Thalassobacillus pellis TaxID=748008 RepID=UPI00195FE0E3|nr:manganese efflux pump [Thalassobacillus pellis]MBM7551775.1 putative Mn2+ efflux pump MntP [Thalassobacillus pellis]